jgi:hypothetical protein
MVLVENLLRAENLLRQFRNLWQLPHVLKERTGFVPGR